MDSPLSLEIKCSVCLSDFTDPVTLACEHYFCRKCITGHMHASLGPSACPECKRPYSEADLKPSRLLRNITSRVREHLSAEHKADKTQRPETKDQNISEEELICPEHEEKLKLFCETDQKLTCVICRDGDKHKRHIFKPAKESAEINKGRLKSALGFLTKENRRMDYMIQRQTTEITKTEEKSKTSLAQISAQFEEMHKFLRWKEEETRKQVEKVGKEMTEVMLKNYAEINKTFLESKQKEVLLQSALETEQPDQFLQWWNETGFLMTEGMKLKGSVSLRIQHKPRKIFLYLDRDRKYVSKLKDLTVVPHSLHFGPCETHLQFFVWKEMLGAIKPVPDSLTLKNPGDSYLKLSPGSDRIRQADRRSGLYKNYNPGTVSVESFQSGQHCWEIEVGDKPDWTVGIMMGEVNLKTKSAGGEIQLHLKHNKGYVLSCDGWDTSLRIRDKPRKIVLYLDCDRKQVSFYNADNMSLLVKRNYSSNKPCCVSLVPGLYLDGVNIDPVTICTYGP